MRIPSLIPSGILWNEDHKNNEGKIIHIKLIQLKLETVLLTLLKGAGVEFDKKPYQQSKYKTLDR